MSQEFLQPENDAPQNVERFESDTQKIIHRHLQNKNDTITDDDIRSVRIGMTPPVADVDTEAFEEESKEKSEEHVPKDTDDATTTWNV